MEKQSKQLVINGKTYTLSLTQYPDATWECRIFETGAEVVYRIKKQASAREVKYLGHVIAYDLEFMRRDQACEQECEKGWEEEKTAKRE
jgi:hypothetical protein